MGLFSSGTTNSAYLREIANCLKYFQQKGPEYTQGFLDAYSGIGKIWANITLDTRYLGAQSAAASFQRPVPAIC